MLSDDNEIPETCDESIISPGVSYSHAITRDEKYNTQSVNML